MLVYFLENNHGDRNYIDYLAKTLNLKVVTVAEHPNDILKHYIKKKREISSLLLCHAYQKLVLRTNF